MGRYPKFSIVVPTHNRADTTLPRALLSLQKQTFGGFEVIIVDDHTTPEHGSVDQVVAKLRDNRFYVIHLENSPGRCAARNVGMTAAVGEWICWLDDDDEYVSVYLEALEHAMWVYPNAKCFNFGAILYHRKWINYDGQRVIYRTSIRPTFRPKWIVSEGRHEEFKSGHIGTGSFVFHREVYEEIGSLPFASSPYKLHELATDVHHLYPYPPQKKLGHAGSLGNPWGDDWLMFYRITRKFQSIPLDLLLYIQHVR